MTQTESILEYMNKYQSITAIEALSELGCFRLAARIHDLERKGYVIPRETITVTGKRTGKQYRIKRYFKPLS